MDCTKLLLIEPDRLIREGLKVLFRGSIFSTVCEAEDLRAAELMIQEGLEADLALIDAAHQPEETVAGLIRLRAMAPDLRVVLLTTAADLPLFLDSNIDIHGLLLRDISAEALIRSLHLALLGEPVCAIHKHLLRTPKTDALPLENPSVAMLNLCPRERSILQCLTVGRSNKEIARELSLSEATVKAHVKVIMRKLKARNRTQAAIWGIANGMERRAPAMLELA